MTKAKAAVVSGVNGSIDIKEYDVPKAGPGEFILRVELGTICGTDAHIYKGHLDFVPFPIVLGHEFCGIIEELGDGVATDTNGQEVKKGDRVTIAPGASCGHCYFCAIAKTPTRCTNCPTYGFMVNEDPYLLTGGFAQYVHVKLPNTKFFKTTAPPEIATLGEPMSIAVHGYQRAGGVPFGGTVVVQGTGCVGIGAIAFAREGGAKQVIAIGGPKTRLDLVKQLGADVTIDISEMKDPAERMAYVKSLTQGGLGADMVVEAAGFPVAVPQGLDMLRDSGKFVELGHFTDVGTTEINPHWHMVRKNCDIFGVWGSAAEHIRLALAMMERGNLPYEKIVSHKIPLSQIKEAFDAINNGEYKIDGQEVCKIAVDPWK